MARVLVMIPTYNEAENIRNIIVDVLRQGPDIDVLVVDDESPDGTGEIAEKMGRGNRRVKVLRRGGKRGRGLAGAEGYRYALDGGYGVLLEMDADYSHDPNDIPKLLKALEGADVVLGSRFAEGGGESGRPLYRRIITGFANAYIRLMLGVRVRDCNSGFRCFRRKVLEAVNPETIFSEGPGIVQEVLFKAHRGGFVIREVPIRFSERRAGSSKLGLKAVVNGGVLVLKLRLQSIFGG